MHAQYEHVRKMNVSSSKLHRMGFSRHTVEFDKQHKVALMTPPIFDYLRPALMRAVTSRNKLSFTVFEIGQNVTNKVEQTNLG